jgi:hypothetical protein
MSTGVPQYTKPHDVRVFREAADAALAHIHREVGGIAMAHAQERVTDRDCAYANEVVQMINSIDAGFAQLKVHAQSLLPLQREHTVEEARKAGR